MTSKSRPLTLTLGDANGPLCGQAVEVGETYRIDGSGEDVDLVKATPPLPSTPQPAEAPEGWLLGHDGKYAPPEDAVERARAESRLAQLHERLVHRAGVSQQHGEAIAALKAQVGRLEQRVEKTPAAGSVWDAVDGIRQRLERLETLPDEALVGYTEALSEEQEDLKTRVAKLEDPQLPVGTVRQGVSGCAEVRCADGEWREWKGYPHGPTPDQLRWKKKEKGA